MPSSSDTTSRRALLRRLIDRLEDARIEDSARNAERMLGEVLGCRRAQLYAYPEAEVGPGDIEAVNVMLQRRLEREPLQYVLGHTEFYGLRIAVTPAVLIPRPETEVVVERALTVLPEHTQPHVLDVGTGSGCIALAIKSERPDARVFSCDVSRDALDVAHANARALGLDVAFRHVDILDDDAHVKVPNDLDLLISNPPYVPDDEAETLEPEVYTYEPHAALFSGKDPLRFYRAIARVAREVVATAGWLVFETHSTYAGAVAEMLQQRDWSDVQRHQDLAGHERIVLARRTEGTSAE